MTQRCSRPTAKLSPYWWDAVPRPALGDAALPQRADVVVVGSGYTGLHAALQTARAGRHTLVLDAEDAGWGCSTRNGGQISTSVKPGFDQLARRHGPQRARDILLRRPALAALVRRVRRSREDRLRLRRGRPLSRRAQRRRNSSSWRRRSNTSPRAWRSTRTWCRAPNNTRNSAPTPTSAAWSTSATPAWTRRATTRACSIVCSAAGATVVARCPVTRIERDGAGFRVTHGARRRSRRATWSSRPTATPATLTPWLQRRVIPIGSYIIATEPLPPEQMERLMPKNRIVSDTRKVVFYYRASPDQTRILFGGRVSTSETDPRDQRPDAARRPGGASSPNSPARASAIPGAASSPTPSTS